jgi:hypothetical protein
MGKRETEKKPFSEAVPSRNCVLLRALSFRGASGRDEILSTTMRRSDGSCLREAAEAPFVFLSLFLFFFKRVFVTKIVD